MKKRITFDFETRSAVDLKKTGAYKYSLDPTTQPTCMAAKFHGQYAMMFLTFEEVNRPWKSVSEPFKYVWSEAIRQGYEFSAHNAFFERSVYENILVKRLGWPLIPSRQYRCTAAKAAACALPRNLQGAGEAMNLKVQKDRRGYAAMMATCRPTKAYKAWQKKLHNPKTPCVFVLLPNPSMFLEPEHNPAVWQTLYEYCKIDVLAEEALDDALPDLSPEEQEIWLLNQKLNWRGIRVDIPAVKKIVSIMEVEGKEKRKSLDKLTMGLITKPGATKSILRFLESEGVKLPNLQKQTVEDTLASFELSKDTRSLLEIRKALSLASTKKYQAFLNRANEDDRIRDLLMYHGASTGRDTGTGIQPQNFPRGLIKIDPERPYEHVENILENDHEMLKLIYGESLPQVFSSVLRNMFLPSKGYELFVSDFSKIEVAVCWWLAGNQVGLDILNSGKDPYVVQAMLNTLKKESEIIFDDRQLGKAQILGAQFGLGWEKFMKTSWDLYRLKLSETQSKKAIQDYRRIHFKVPQLWKNYENAAISAVMGIPHETNGCGFYVKNGFLWVRLPSGRKLAYKNPRVTWRETEFGPRKTLQFDAVNSKTKKWGPERTWGGVLTENIVSGTARDLLMQAILRLDKLGYRILLTIHDEVVAEKPVGQGTLEEFNKTLCEVPAWARGCPIEAKGWSDFRYRK